MKIFLTLTDFTVPSYQVKLRFTLTGNGYSITTSSLLNLPTTTLSPGSPVEISGSDLAPYLSAQNLLFSGIDVADYEIRKVLPEGPCQICVEVIDFSNPNQAVLSNPACTQVWFSLNDPPLLNTPFCGNQITPTDPQQLIFSWTPLHMNSLHSAGTNYVFELFEIRPDGADPNQVVNSSLPIFIQVTDQTFINYGITEPQLQTGMSYVWRVRAQDIQGRDFFRNNGYSSVCTFTYGNIAESLADGITLTLNTAGTGTRKGDAWWNVSSTFTSYKVEVRKTGNPDYEWFPYDATTGELKIYQLEPETQYECRVKGLIGTEYESEWSNISVFTTQALTDYPCGSTTQPPGEIIFTPLTNAIAGLTFEIGQFELFVTDIEPLDPILQPGHYRGTGKIAVGFALINIRVSFDDILVDDNLKVRSGKVEAITEGIDAWLAGMNEPDYYVDGTITDFEWSDSTSLTVWVDGVPQTFSFSDHDPLVIQDEDGMIYTFHSDGTYTVISILIYSTDALAGTADYRIDFSKDENQIYGFDKKEYAAWLSDYEVIRLLDSTNYFVSYKSLAPDQTDYVIANITSENPLSNVTFVATKPGTTFNLNSTQINDSTYRVSLAGMNSSMYVYAEDDGNRIGKLWVKVLPAIEKEIVFVPVNGATLSQIGAIETELNDIYKQANVSFDVTTKSNYQSSTWDLNTDGKLQTGDVHLMSHYSEEMRLLRDEYFASDTGYNKNAYYIFIIPEFLQDDLGGYMVRGKGVGFLKNGETPRTAAHELAHGIFALEHTFPAIEEGTTENLLDYSNGTHLAQKQWYYIHNPLPAFSFLDDEESGEYLHLLLQDDNFSINEEGVYFGYLTPTLERIILPKSYTPIFALGIGYDRSEDFIPGTLLAFIDSSGFTFKSKYNESAFLGYYSQQLSEYYIDSISVEVDDNSYSIMLPSYFQGNQKVIRYKFKYAIPRFASEDVKTTISANSEELQILAHFGSLNPSLYSKTFDLNSSIFSNDQTDLSNFSYWIINNDAQYGHSEQPEIFVIVKIAEMAKRHETYFYDFTIHFDNWSNQMTGGVWDELHFEEYKGTFLLESNRIEHNPFLYDFYQDFLREFMEYVDYRQEMGAACLEYAFEQFSMDLLRTLPESGFFNNINNVVFTLDQSAQFKECVSGLSQDEMYQLSDTNRNNALAILLWNEANGYNQVVNLIKYSNNQKHHFEQTTLLFDEFGNNDRYHQFLAACPIELLEFIQFERRLILLEAIVEDDAKWYYSDYESNLLNNLIVSTPVSKQLLLLSEFKSQEWFSEIQVQMSEWTDVTDMFDLQTIQMVFSNLALMVVDHYQALNINTLNHTISYSSGHEPNAGYLTSNGSAPYNSNFMLAGQEQYELEFSFADFPILVGNTGLSDSWDLGSNDGMHQNYFVYPNQENIPFQFTGGTLNVTQNYKLRESIGPPIPAIVAGDPYNFNNYQHLLSPIDYDVFHLNHQYSLHPFELVEFVFVEDHNTAGYKKGDRLLLPAFYGICIAQSLENEDFQVAMEWVEPVVMAAALVLAPESAGSSLLLAATIFQTVDAVISEYKVSLDADFASSPFVQIWDTFDDVITIIDAAGAVTMVPKLINGLYKIGQFGLVRGWKLVEAVVMRRMLNLPYLAENFSTPYHKFATMKMSEAFRTGMTYNQVLNFYQALGVSLKANILSRISDDLSALKIWISGLDESAHIDLLLKLDDLSANQGGTDLLTLLNQDILTGSNTFKIALMDASIFDEWVKMYDANFPASFRKNAGILENSKILDCN